MPVQVKLPTTECNEYDEYGVRIAKDADEYNKKDVHILVNSEAVFIGYQGTPDSSVIPSAIGFNSKGETICQFEHDGQPVVLPVDPQVVAELLTEMISAVKKRFEE